MKRSIIPFLTILACLVLFLLSSVRLFSAKGSGQAIQSDFERAFKTETKETIACAKPFTFEDAKRLKKRYEALNVSH